MTAFLNLPLQVWTRHFCIQGHTTLLQRVFGKQNRHTPIRDSIWQGMHFGIMPPCNPLQFQTPLPLSVPHVKHQTVNSSELGQVLCCILCKVPCTLIALREFFRSFDHWSRKACLKVLGDQKRENETKDGPYILSYYLFGFQIYIQPFQSARQYRSLLYL